MRPSLLELGFFLTGSSLTQGLYYYHGNYKGIKATNFFSSIFKFSLTILMKLTPFYLHPSLIPVFDFLFKSSTQFLNYCQKSFH